MEDVRPDWSFMKQLKALDKRLNCKFNGEHFVITYDRDGRPPVNIWKVVDERGGFRQPDRRELEMIQKSNIENVSPTEQFNLVKMYMENFREKERIRAREEIRNRTKDNRIQLIHAFSRIYGAGKGNAAFRRINSGRQGSIIIP